MVESVVQSHAEIVVGSSEKKLIRVLHVDDELGFLKVAKQCLELQGPFHVDTVGSVEEALNKLKEKEYDAVVSDYQMPGKDGLEFLEMLRKNGNTIPFIMFTGKGREEVAVKAWRLGADHYVNKTGDPETVYCELAHCLRSTVKKHFAETQIGEKVQKLQTIYQNAVEGITYVDAEQNIVYANKAFADIIGYEQEQLAGMNVRRIVDDENWAKIENETKRRQQGESSRYEAEFRRRDSAVRNVLISGAPLLDHDGRFAGTIGIILDITEQKKATEELKASEEKHRSLAEKLKAILASSPDAIIISDLNGKLIDCNEATLLLSGYSSKEEIVGKSSFEFIAEKDRERALKDLRKAIGQGTTKNIEYTLLKKGKEEYLGELSANALRDSLGNLTGFVATIRDITERKQKEKQLKESEEKYRDLFENAVDAILTLDLKGSITAVNNSVLRFGYKKEDLVGKNILDFVSKEYWPAVTRDFSKVTQGEPAKNETELAVPAGKILVEYNARAIIKENNVAGVQINIRDITGRKRSEELLRESEERFRGLFEGIQDPVGIFVGKEGRLIDYNKAFKKLSRYTDEELKGKAFLDFVHPDDHAMVLEKYQTEYSEDKLPLLYEIRGMNKEGESIPLEISVSTYKKKGRAIGIEVIHRNITERKRYEQSLSALNTHSLKLNTAESMEEIYRLTMDAVEKTLGFDIGFFMVVDKGMLRVVDHRGYPESFSFELPTNGTQRGVSVEVVRSGKPINVPDAEKEDAWVEFMPGIRSGLDVPVKIGSKVLGVIGVDSKELNAFNEKDQELLEILASHAATAISSLDRARELEAYALEIQETKHKFEGSFFGNPEPTVYLAPDFRILDINQRFEKLFGYSLSEIREKHIDDVVVPKDKMKEAKMLDGKAVEGYVYHDTFRMRKDGSQVPVSISAAPIKVEDKLIGYIGVYKDISELKNTQKKLETMNEKLRVVGGLTRHDVRNKLSAITGNIYLHKKKLANHPDVLEGFNDMQSACEQIVRIFEFARDYERLGIEELAFVDVETTVGKAVSSFSDLKGVRIVSECRGLAVLADSLLERLFYNLIDNSLKYGERLTQIGIHYEKSEDELRLVYEDNGVGIPDNMRSNLFKEGFTSGKGAGYGLFMIKRMCEVYGWAIRETGKQGKGAQFILSMPRISSTGKVNYQIQNPRQN
jgi:PAS domain S-box-containing protein